MHLLISSFDATIREKRAFHPAPASRGFASHVFLVLRCCRCRRRRRCLQVLSSFNYGHVKEKLTNANYDREKLLKLLRNKDVSTSRDSNHSTKLQSFNFIPEKRRLEATRYRMVHDHAICEETKLGEVII